MPRPTYIFIALNAAEATTEAISTGLTFPRILPKIATFSSETSSTAVSSGWAASASALAFSAASFRAAFRTKMFQNSANIIFINVHNLHPYQPYVPPQWPQPSQPRLFASQHFFVQPSGR